MQSRQNLRCSHIPGKEVDRVQSGNSNKVDVAAHARLTVCVLGNGAFVATVVFQNEL